MTAWGANDGDALGCYDLRFSFEPQETWRAVLRHHGGAYTTVLAHVEHREPGVFRAWLGDTNYWGDGATRDAAVTAMAVSYGEEEPYTLAEVVPPGGSTRDEQIAQLRSREETT